jgi:hypothetical protein
MVGVLFQQTNLEVAYHFVTFHCAAAGKGFLSCCIGSFDDNIVVAALVGSTICCDGNHIE